MNPLGNARQKAVPCYKAFLMPVFLCDSGLYFDNRIKKLGAELYEKYKIFDFICVFFPALPAAATA